MAFKKIKGISGLVFEPAAWSPENRKHFCRDCYVCQRCSDDRCAACLNLKKEQMKCGCKISGKRMKR